MMRLFIGLGLPREAGDALWRAASGLGMAGQMTAKDNYHLTLAFLGAREEQDAPPLERILASAAREQAAPKLIITGLGFFGRRENALLYAGLAYSQPLCALADALRARLAGAGETFDGKPFAAHITLARRANLTGARLDAPFAPIAFTADQVTLYNSARVQGVLRYRPVFGAPFLQDGISV